MDDNSIQFPPYPRDPSSIRGQAFAEKADRDLIESGLRQLAPGQCVSLVVGTDKETGERALHACTVISMHGHKTHHAANGQSWRYIPGDEKWSDIGPLTDVVHSS